MNAARNDDATEQDPERIIVWCEVRSSEERGTPAEAFQPGWGFGSPAACAPSGILTPHTCDEDAG
ncbi:hypothetical protein [Microbacterium aurantiacum]|uniref:hypothetical protein n=1 Tax=Microbacterium aurantiacum TaxID=162393 RepID=UPI001F38D700|nr:hypothetical protein [Microbacterium aurantiacum]